MAFTCVSSSIWNLLSAAAESFSAEEQILETLQVGFIPDYPYLVGLGFSKKKKKSCLI